MELSLDKPVALCSDHAGYELKKLIIEEFDKKGIVYKDFGTYGPDSCDYPDFAHPAGYAIDKGECLWGISVCGSGNGIQMTLNKHPKVRAALCWHSEIARLARAHNDANMCSIPARYVSNEEAIDIVNAFMTERFEHGRHEERVRKIPM